MKTTIMVCSIFLLAAGLGCAALSSFITPAMIDGHAVDYVVAAKVADSNDYKGYPNLLKAEKLQTDVDSAHTIIQFDLQQQIHKDDLNYSIHKKVVAANYFKAQRQEEFLFGEKGLLTLGLSLAGFGTFTGLIGLMRKRPGDVTRTEMENAVAQIEGKTSAELSDKQKQFIELVKGVQIFMDENKERFPFQIKTLKETFDRTQDESTQIAVAQIKASL